MWYKCEPWLTFFFPRVNSFLSLLQLWGEDSKQLQKLLQGTSGFHLALLWNLNLETSRMLEKAQNMINNTRVSPVPVRGQYYGLTHSRHRAQAISPAYAAGSFCLKEVCLIECKTIRVWLLGSNPGGLLARSVNLNKSIDHSWSVVLFIWKMNTIKTSTLQRCCMN